MPNALCPIPYAQCPIPNALGQYKIYNQLTGVI